MKWTKDRPYDSRCPYCGVMLAIGGDQGPLNPQRATKDHILPRRHGGTDKFNLIYCCWTCNQDKHHLTLTEWRAVLSIRYRRLYIYHFEKQQVKAVLNWLTVWTRALRLVTP